MTIVRDIPRVGDPAGIAQPDMDAQIHRLPPRIAHVARSMGLGTVTPNGSFRYSRREEAAARAESARRRPQRTRARDFTSADVAERHPDPLDRVEQILFRGALVATELGVMLHQAAQSMKACRLEWEAELIRRAGEGRGS